MSEYPWLVSTWQHWQDLLQQGALPNAILCQAKSGTGIEDIVEKLAMAVVCKNSEQQACGFCHSCELSKGENHPDIHWIRPEKEGKNIIVDQIREANRLALESSQLGGKRIIIISPAEAMNESAANALLKTLETPPEQCHFVLLTTDKSRLLATITSRCQTWLVGALNKEALLSWLSTQPTLDNQIPPDWQHIKMYADSPLLAVEFIKQKKTQEFEQLQRLLLKVVQTKQVNITEAQTLFKLEPLDKIRWLTYILSDVQKSHFGILTEINNSDFIQLSQLLPYQLAYEQYHALVKLQQLLSTSSGLNTELLIVDWLLKFTLA
ncbi:MULTISPECIES: DNA polymerase III subunit delta' C-terminal domain-containing protein [Vibrio]|uniref:DNA polymerase III subunit delta' n=1 Tax=Vibrio algicola TaxID=2662262 RepID=A0A5Q0TGB7_9VIBR|nr:MULTISPECIES: DNA polymerase III subunit delta' C-terminal domain-containing protein [Vibrio]MBD1575466.1 DNA polymerase III subunit delta' [Vibrio sp. S11_S32]